MGALAPSNMLCASELLHSGLSWRRCNVGSFSSSLGAAARAAPSFAAKRVSVRAALASLQRTRIMEYKKLGDSDLVISEITLGTMTWGNQNTEKEAHEQLSYAFDNGVNIFDSAEAYPIPMSKEKQGQTDRFISTWLKSMPRDKVIVATKVAGYSERSTYLRDSGKTVRVDADNITESVEKSLKRLGTDHIDLLQIHWLNLLVAGVPPTIAETFPSVIPGLLLYDRGVLIVNDMVGKTMGPDRYVPLFGERIFDPSKIRESTPIVDQLRALKTVVDQGKVRYVGVSNETSWGVMEFVYAAKQFNLPKIVSIQNNYSLLTRIAFEIDLVEVCLPQNCNIGLLAYSPLAGGALSGKYINPESSAWKSGRFGLFPGYMGRYSESLARAATMEYVEIARKHNMTPVELALGYCRDRHFVTSSIIGATSMEQLKQNIDAFTTTRPMPEEVTADIEKIFKKYRDPAIM